MKAELLEDLVCPACGGGLNLEAGKDFRRDGAPAEIMSGWLACAACPERYPVIRGVPRMLLGELRAALRCDYPEFYGDVPDPAARPASPVAQSQLQTMRSFGYEWRHFADIRPEGESNFRWYFEGIDPAGLKGKRVLDAGCGKGRHLFYVAQNAGKAIGVDLSPAVDAAFDNTHHLPAAHAVQADLFHLPFRRGSFDMIYSLGVLHHLPDPEAGYRHILGYGRPGAQVLLYLYWSLNDEPRWKRWLLAAVNQLRRVTTRMPFWMLRPFAWLAAVGAHLALVLPYKILRKSRWSAFAQTLPLKMYADYPFRLLYQDQFDRFSAPIEHRYNREQVVGWLERSGLEQWTLLRGSGWRASGRIPGANEKPMASSAERGAGA